MSTFTPREIVSELDRFIIGQDDAKRAVAIALRNRWRRLNLGDDLRDMQAANASNMRGVIAAYGYVSDDVSIAQWQAYASINSPPELLNWLSE